MIDEPTAHDDKPHSGDTQNDSQEKTVAQPVQPEPQAKAATQNQASTKKKKAPLFLRCWRIIRKRKESPKWTDIAIVILTVGIVILAFFQWREMHEGGIDTHALAQATQDMSDAASDQADAAQQFSDTAEETNGKIGEAVEQLGKAAETSKRSLEANTRQSKTALDASIAASRSDERALRHYRQTRRHYS